MPRLHQHISVRSTMFWILRTLVVYKMRYGIHKQRKNSSEYKWLIYSSVGYLLECKLEKYYSFEVNNGVQQKAHISAINSYFLKCKVGFKNIFLRQNIFQRFNTICQINYKRFCV